MTANAKSVPEWAMREFCDRANLNFDEAFRGPNTVVLRSAIRAGGKLIAEHEEAPVDPLLIEAREIARTVMAERELKRNNGVEYSVALQAALAALKAKGGAK